MYPKEMLDINNTNRELVSLYRLLHDPEKREVKFTLSRVNALGVPLVLYKENNKTYFLIQYGNEEKVSRRLLYNARGVIPTT